MKKASLFRLLILSTAVLAGAMLAQEWERLEDVPVPVQRWACLTYSYSEYGSRSYDTVWGVFPAPAYGKTWFLYYDCVDGHWHYPADSVINRDMKQTALTFQWLEEGVVYLVGQTLDGDNLFWYPLNEGRWHSEPITAFALGPRPGLAYKANPGYNQQLEPIPGWLYCLAGGGQQFWRYWLPSSYPPVTVDGIYPAQGALIADQTPVFIWQEEGAAIEYRLVVATDPQFSNTVINVITTVPQYQVETRLANGDYYWQTASRSAGSGWKTGPVHSFRLQGGWERLADIPTRVGDGGALAYCGKFFGTSSDIFIAFVGGGDTVCYAYVDEYNRWVRLYSEEYVPPQNIGAALSAHKYLDIDIGTPWAIFGVNSDINVYCYDWGRWLPWGGEVPEPLGLGASLASGKYDSQPAGHYLYLVTGEDPGSGGRPRRSFWRKQVFAYDGQTKVQKSGGMGDEGLYSNQMILAGGKGVIAYVLDRPANVRIAVFDAAGRRVALPYAGRQDGGHHLVRWHFKGAGAYFVLVDIDDERHKFKVVVR
ncbi:MAG: DUF4962 domain-containing protein [candidate division WOR-3 bacterium]